MNLTQGLPKRAAEMSRAIVTLMQDREAVSAQDLLALGFRRQEIELYRDDAIAEAAQRYEAYSRAEGSSRKADRRRAEQFFVRIGNADEPAYLACLHPRRFTTEIAEAQRWNTKGTAEKAAAALPPSYRAEAVIESLKL